MANEVRAYQVTIPAGTAQAAPMRASLAMPPRDVVGLEIVVPPGPSGTMGFAITMGGVNVLPIQPGTFIVTDNQRIEWPLNDLPDSGAWQLTGYNTDVFDHTVYLTWLVNQIGAQTSRSPVENVALSALSGI
jgi:hypothetical protein